MSTRPLPLAAAPASALPVGGGIVVPYALVLFAWSTSWIAMHAQVGEVAPEVSVAWRFLIASAACFALCAARGERLGGYTPGDHARFAFLGVTIFSTNFMLFYHAGQTIVSGLLAVIFALTAPINVVTSVLLLRQPVPGRVVAGALMGVTGVALLFLPEILERGVTYGTVGGLAFAVTGTLVFCTGNVLSARVQARGLPLLPATAWGMLYGCLWCCLVALVLGRRFTVEWTALYLGSLVYLALVCSVVAFLAYLTLLRRIGPARAGYATVMFPIFALLLSASLEGYRWTLLAGLGMVLAAAGNVLVLAARRPGQKA